MKEMNRAIYAGHEVIVRLSKCQIRMSLIRAIADQNRMTCTWMHSFPVDQNTIAWLTLTYI